MSVHGWGISSSGRALDSHSRGTGIDTRILQTILVLFTHTPTLRCQGELTYVKQHSIWFRKDPESIDIRIV